MRVIDSSVFVKYLSREKGFEHAAKLIEEGGVSFELALKETANALWKKVILKELPESVALEIVNDLASDPPFLLADQKKHLLEAFKIAVKHGLTVYDTLFIALAQAENLELVTADEKQFKVALKEKVRAIIV
ncbi:PIN domain nuclease [Candidatus Marsarchaeota G2 archaeon OSP_D]|uniref:Ribonuclease VapC n=2 Tax=Candidatus Marsarchaeota group 2 TaxID=2203771 RepID=A0A2R6C0H2_9ARCH|nr:MAG: PIN domain nuclease [Candidatus Marsarchaeota G2 archaeon OSP_D]PSO04389.1 MAG: PIN domain nuclease [Candidatus Marsarchaeota G2 archaeon ECH_B_SAG-G06]